MVTSAQQLPRQVPSPERLDRHAKTPSSFSNKQPGSFNQQKRRQSSNERAGSLPRAAGFGNGNSVEQIHSQSAQQPQNGMRMASQKSFNASQGSNKAESRESIKRIDKIRNKIETQQNVDIVIVLKTVANLELELENLK